VEAIVKIHIQPRHLFQLAVRSFKAWSDDYAPSMGAAIAYYTVFSVAPLLVIVIAVAGAVFGREAVQGQIAAELGGLVGQQGATMVQQLVAASSNTHKGLVAGTISIFVLLLGATSVFTELQNALDRIWHVPPSQKPTGVWAILQARLLSFGLILGLVFLLMVSLVVSTVVAAFGSYTSRLFPGAEILLQVLNTLVSLAISTGLFAMIYKMLPNTRIAWRDVWVGAIVTSVLFEIGKFLIGLYLGKSSMSQTFAAAGSLVILIAWIYYAAQIFLLGAEFTKLYAQEHGSHAAAQAMQGTQATAHAGLPVDAPVPLPALPHAARHAHHAARKPSPEREAAIARLQYNREQLRHTEPVPKLSRAKSALAGASTVAGMLVAAWARRSRRKHQAA
jgi:membrane protein